MAMEAFCQLCHFLVYFSSRLCKTELSVFLGMIATFVIP